MDANASMRRAVTRHYVNLRAIIGRHDRQQLDGRNRSATVGAILWHARELRAGLPYLSERQQAGAEALLTRVENWERMP